MTTFSEPQTARTISASNIQQAYVFKSSRQQRRIRIYGAMNRKFLKSLMPLEKKTPSEVGANEKRRVNNRRSR